MMNSPSLKELWHVVVIDEDGIYSNIHATCVSKRLAEEIAEQANTSWDETESYREYVVESSLFYESLPKSFHHSIEDSLWVALTRRDN